MLEEFSIAGDTVRYNKDLEMQKRRVRELVINACREYNQLVLSVRNLLGFKEYEGKNESGYIEKYPSLKLIFI